MVKGFLRKTVREVKYRNMQKWELSNLSRSLFISLLDLYILVRLVIL